MVARHGTVCFATDPANMLMWSYYAEGHSGIAVRFGTDLPRYAALGEALKRQGVHPFPVEVKYSDDLPNCNYYTAATHEMLKVILGTKSSAWRHEGEWRFVLADFCGPLRIPASIITGLILGMRINPSHEAIIRQWVAERTPGIELLRISHKPNSFQLEVVPA